MRDQFFGDINDYRKYGLLRTLVGDGDVKLGVCWMLTPSDASGHGGKTDYLKDSERWSKYDSCLFTALREWVEGRKLRCVNLVEQTDLIRSAKYHHPHNPFVPELKAEREEYFQEMLQLFSDVGLVFFDPDNGLEIPSKPYTEKPSSKHIYFGEVNKAFDGRFRHSLLVYQHFIRENRAQFIQRRMNEIKERTRTAPRQLRWIRTPHVVFFLAMQQDQVEKLSSRAQEFCNRWSGKDQRIEMGSPQ
jgi:hypothetical protein